MGTKSALPKVITTMRQALNLGSFFTTGADEVRQWTIRKGTKAPQAAGVIHGGQYISFLDPLLHALIIVSLHQYLILSLIRRSTDFEKTFIQCIVYNYDTLKELGDEATVKANGKVMTKGKDYVVEDGDIILIKAGAAKS